MEGITLIEGKELDQIKKRLEAIERNQLALIKMMQQFVPQKLRNNVPDFISIVDACKKYHISTQTLYNKLKCFKALKKREIDRIQSGSHFLINEVEFQEALRLKSGRNLFVESKQFRNAA